MTIKRTPAGQLLAAWKDPSDRCDPSAPPARPAPRTPLAAALSDDEGRTWTRHTCIETDPARNFSYPAVYFVDNRHALLAYCAGRPKGNGLDGIVIRHRLP